MNGLGWLWKVLGVCRWFSGNCWFSSDNEIRCLRCKRKRQLWGLFVLSSNKDTKISLKQTIKIFGNSTHKISLKKNLGGWEKFCLMKIDIYIFMQILPVLTPPPPIFGAIFSRISSFGLLLVGRSVFKTINSTIQIFLFIETLNYNYIFQVSILSISTKVMKGNDNLCAFLKSCSQEKIKFWFNREPWMCFFVKSRNSQIFYAIRIMIFGTFAQNMYFYLIVASLYLI